MRRHRRWAAERFNKSSQKLRAKATHISTKKLPLWKKFLKNKLQMVNAEPPRRQSDIPLHSIPMIGTAPTWDSTNSQYPSKFCSRHITCPYLIFASLSHTGSTHQGETYIRQDATTLYCRHITNDVYIFVRQFRSWAQIGSQMKNKRKLRLFQAAGPLEIIASDILRPLPRITTVNQHFVIKTDRFSKLKRAILTAKISSRKIATIFLNNWVMPYWITS